MMIRSTFRREDGGTGLLVQVTMRSFTKANIYTRMPYGNMVLSVKASSYLCVYHNIYVGCRFSSIEDDLQPAAAAVKLYYNYWQLFAYNKQNRNIITTFVRRPNHVHATAVAVPGVAAVYQTWYCCVVGVYHLEGRV